MENNPKNNEFIIKAIKIHGKKYDYSLVNYKNNRTKVKIICPIHGGFEQSGYLHINKKHGCQICGNIQSHITQANSKENFIEKAKKIHKNKYDYSLVKYINNKTKVKIICEKHGDFEKRPDCHIGQKQGCPKCKYFISNEKILTRTKKFIEKSLIIHNHKYDYSLVEYIGAHHKIKIICPKHGLFEQKANNHLNNKQGCPICRSSKGELVIQEFLNKNNIKYHREHKFSDCKNIKPLPFDFYLPDYNICIEYDGALHFRPWERSKTGVDKFNKRKMLDVIRNEYCEYIGIKLIRISYKEFNHVENILNKELYIE